MSDHYHDPADLRFLKEMGKLAPAEFNAWLNLDKIVARAGTPTASVMVGTVESLAQADAGPPMHAVIIPATGLHFEEERAWRSWRSTD